MADEDKADKLTGKAKEVTGAVTGDEELEAEGKAQHGLAKAKERVEDVADKVTDAVKNAINKDKTGGVD